MILRISFDLLALVWAWPLFLDSLIDGSFSISFARAMSLRTVISATPREEAVSSNVHSLFSDFAISDLIS